MNPITERFTTQPRGYDKNQVDRYIQMLSDEYDNLQKQYAELSNQYASVTTQSSAHMEAISKALVSAEVHAKQIITEAKNEAARIIGGAHMELQKLQQDKASAVAEINNLVNRLRGLISTTNS